MGLIVNNNPDGVINQLMNADMQSMKDSIHLHQKGVFQSSLVTVGNNECSVDQLIQELGNKIHRADAKQDEPNLEKLKAVLTAVSDKEKADRDFASSLFHLFSSQDEEVDQLQHEADIKIKDHKIYEKLLNEGITITFTKEQGASDLKSNLITIHSRSIHRNDPEGVVEGRIFITFEPDSKHGEWSYVRKRKAAKEVLIYIEQKEEYTKLGLATTFEIALANEVKNGNIDITAENVVNILKNKDR